MCDRLEIGSAGYRVPRVSPQTSPQSFAIGAGFSMATAACAWVAKIVIVRRTRKLRQSVDETTNFYVH